IIDIILSAESLTDLVGKMEVIGMIVQNNNNIMEEQIADRKKIEDARVQIDEAKTETENVKAGMEENRNQLVAQRKELDKKVQLVTEKYNLTSGERDKLLSKQRDVASQTEKISNQMKAERERIAAEKARKEEEARKAAEAQRQAQLAAQREAEKKKQVQTASSSASSSSSTSASTPAPAPNPAPSNSGGWVRPSGGYVTSEYGYRFHPVHKVNRLHAGIDIGGGGPIVAAKSGTVIAASYHFSLGYHVRIDHGGGLTTVYGHMKPDLRVSAGQSVSAGQRIGTMGTTGTSTGVHLHFEVRQNGAPQNPRNYVGF
ncbi:MAG TPA: peptidoglycan DD-metalloendopeptidase family protein, partial [Atopostipes sp.]|nr:peptidoglycan DD-metalloendopeptidase family protein [Atopostipes sp.]